MHRLVFPFAELRERGPGLDGQLLADERLQEMDAKPALLRDLFPEVLEDCCRLREPAGIDARSREVVLQLAGGLGNRFGHVLARLVDVAEIDQLADRRMGIDGIDLRVWGMAAVFAGHCLAADRPAPPAVKAATQPLLAAHCLKCHGPDDANGGFRIDTLPATVDSIEAAELWHRVLNVLNSGEMPPDEAKQIEPAAKADLLDDLAHAAAADRQGAAPGPARQASAAMAQQPS